MRFLLIGVLFLSSVAGATCKETIVLSEAQRAISDFQKGTVEGGYGAFTCAMAPQEPCLCYDGIDFEVAALSNGQFVIDPARVAAKQARLAAEAEAAAKSAANRQLIAGLANANTLPALKAVVQAIVEEMGLK